ncbi:hypothetical protein ACLK19_29640 [Escherichia coli]
MKVFHRKQLFLPGWSRKISAWRRRTSQEAARRKSIEKELEWVRQGLKAASRKVKHVWHALKS